jgi:hypothetical protein
MFIQVSDGRYINVDVIAEIIFNDISATLITKRGEKFIISGDYLLDLNDLVG